MIGIVTFHRAVNYGAVLQTYALGKKIEKLGGEYEIIDYRCPFIESEYKLICKRDYSPFRFEISYFRHLVASIISIGMKKRKNQSFRDFLAKYTKLSPVYTDSNELEKIQDRYQAFITGSDQVWSPALTADDDVYFLEFVKDNKKKFSYAASLGNVRKGFQLDQRFIDSIKTFEKISVREESGSKYIEEAADRTSDVHVDPTLLLSRNDWGKMAEKPSESRYLLVYSVCDPYYLLASAKEIAQKENLTVVYLQDKVFSMDKQVKYVKAVSPEQFVGYFQYADYVVTNSFHGTVFSIIFHKQFMVELKNKESRNQRVPDLLNLLGIEDREIVDGVTTSYKKEIDWEQVETRLASQRAYAEGYLNQIIRQQ